MSLMLDAWPEDEPPSPPPPKRRLWPWLVGVAGAVAVWAIPYGANPFHDAFSFAVFAIPTMLALVGVTLLARTRLPGWTIAVAHFAVLPLAMFIPLGVVAAVTSSGSADLASGSANLFAGLALIYSIGCIWALTAILICSLVTAGRALVHAVRRDPRARAADSPHRA